MDKIEKERAKLKKAQEKEEKEHKKYIIKAEKEKQKRIKHLMKKSKADKETLPEMQRKKILEYASKVTYGGEVVLPDELRNDKAFLLDLYKANTCFTNWIKPTKEMQNDIDFMLEYVKCSYEKSKNEYTDSWHTSSEIKWAIENYEDLIRNPEFIEKLSKTFPNVNMIETLKRMIAGYSMNAIFDKEKQKKDKEDFQNVIRGLSTETLCNHARLCGRSVITYIPKDIPSFAQVVSAGIDKDGFDSLRYLDVEQILDNKDLIIKAYAKDGFKEFKYYIESWLHPIRTYYYMCHGEEHDYSKYDERYDKVQKALMADKDIKEIYALNGNKIEEKHYSEDEVAQAMYIVDCANRAKNNANNSEELSK